MQVKGVEALRDGIFAIAMTLLMFGLKVPGPLHKTLFAELLDLTPKFIVYLVSFIVLGILWIGHHNQVHFVKKTDRIYLWINIFFYFFISLVPFSAALLGEYPLDHTSIIFYALNLTACSLMLFFTWNYSIWNKLIQDPLEKEFIRSVNIRILLSPVIYVIAIFVSFFAPVLSLILLIVPLMIIIFPGRVDRWLR